MKLLRPTAALVAAFACAIAVAAPNQPSTHSRSKTKAKQQPAAAVAPAPLPAADAEQLLAAAQVLLGQLDCELGQVLQLSRTPGHDGYIDGEVLRRKATFKPIRSTTGALRLEQVRDGDLLLIQIPSKTILMDVKAGKRLIDNCQQADQRKEAASAATGATDPLGIKAPGQIAISGTPSSKN